MAAFRWVLLIFIGTCACSTFPTITDNIMLIYFPLNLRYNFLFVEFLEKWIHVSILATCHQPWAIAVNATHSCCGCQQIVPQQKTIGNIIIVTSADVYENQQQSWPMNSDSWHRSLVPLTSPQNGWAIHSVIDQLCRISTRRSNMVTHIYESTILLYGRSNTLVYGHDAWS